MTIATGQSATLEHTVTDDDTALALGSGDLPVLGEGRRQRRARRGLAPGQQPRGAERRHVAGAQGDRRVGLAHDEPRLSTGSCLQRCHVALGSDTRPR